MNKRFSIMALALLMVLPASLFGALGELRIRYTTPSGVDRVMLYVNGRYKGFIYKDRVQKVMVERGRSHYIRVYRRLGGDLYQQTRTVRFAGRDNRLNVTLSLEKQVQQTGGQLRIRLSSRTAFPSARLYVNGAYKGMVYTSRTTSFPVPAGRHVITVRRQWRGKRYEYRQTIQILRGGSVFRFAYPTVQDGDIPGGDGEEGRARLRVKIRNASPMPSAMLYVNGRYVGRVYRNTYRTYTIPAGQVRIQARRQWRGASYRSRIVSRTVRSGSRIYLLLRMEER